MGEDTATHPALQERGTEPGYSGETQVDPSDLFPALGHHRRRRVLDILRDAPRLSTDELAAHILARERVDSATTIGGETTDQLAIGLRHTHLPHLADADLIDWDPTGKTVVLTGRDRLRSSGTVDRFDDLGVRDDAWDAIETLAQDRRRRTVLSVLDRADGQVGLDDLAAAVTAAGRTDATTALDDPSTESTRQVLYHVHLPALEEAGLIRVDHDEKTAEAMTLPDAIRWVLTDVPLAVTFASD